MSKHDDLKRNLKAAQRRRSRRSTPQSESTTAVVDPESMSSATLDVTGLCVTEILKMNGKRPFRDSEVITAIRASLSGGVPSSSEAQLLHQRLIAISQRADVMSRKFRDALSSLERTATQHRSSDDDTAFMKFLTMLAS